MKDSHIQLAVIAVGLIAVVAIAVLAGMHFDLSAVSTTP